MRSLTALAVAAAITSCAPPPRDAREPSREIAQTCAGLTDDDAANAIGILKANVSSVESKYERITYPKGSAPQRLAGAVIHVRATPGATPQWLTRVLSCHALRHVPEMCAAKDRCPLAVEGARVEAVATSVELAITIEATDATVAGEILRRSQELAPNR